MATLLSERLMPCVFCFSSVHADLAHYSADTINGMSWPSQQYEATHQEFCQDLHAKLPRVLLHRRLGIPLGHVPYRCVDRRTVFRRAGRHPQLVARGH